MWVPSDQSGNCPTGLRRAIVGVLSTFDVPTLASSDPPSSPCVVNSAEPSGNLPGIIRVDSSHSSGAYEVSDEVKPSQDDQLYVRRPVHFVQIR